MIKIRLNCLDSADAYADGFIPGTTGRIGHIDGGFISFYPDNYWRAIYRLKGISGLDGEVWEIFNSCEYEEIPNEKEPTSETQQIESPENQTPVK